jgi:hypothetical protein
VNIVLATVVTHYQQKAFFRLNQQDQWCFSFSHVNNTFS